MNGCFASCPGLKADCASCKPSEGNGDSSTSTDGGGGDGGGKRCRYIVQPGDDVFAIARAAGIDMNTVNMLNVGTPDQYWIVGSSVVLPNVMCNLVRTRIPTPNIPTGTPLLPQTPPPGTTTTTVALNHPTGNGGPGYRAVQPVIPNGGGNREVFTVVQPTAPWVPPMIAGIEETEEEDSIL
jgi:LysM repeat protein